MPNPAPDPATPTHKKEIPVDVWFAQQDRAVKANVIEFKPRKTQHPVRRRRRCTAAVVPIMDQQTFMLIDGYRKLHRNLRSIAETMLSASRAANECPEFEDAILQGGKLEERLSNAIAIYGKLGRFYVESSDLMSEVFQVAEQRGATETGGGNDQRYGRIGQR